MVAALILENIGVNYWMLKLWSGSSYSSKLSLSSMSAYQSWRSAYLLKISFEQTSMKAFLIERIKT